MTVKAVSAGFISVAWRLARRRWADLSGEGARLKGGRWNSPGKAAVYLSDDAALPVLEALVHLDLPPDLIPDDYALMRVDLSALETATPGSWLEDGPENLITETESKAFGDRWIVEARTPVLRVPSIVVPESLNLILNPNHRLASSIPEPAIRSFEFDPRLF
ncbi:MAG: RES family NAD+ phosphorylase [Kiloniellales bacterium]